MKRILIGSSVLVLLLAVILVTPRIIGNDVSSDHTRKATGPLWQDLGSSKADSPRPSPQPEQNAGADLKNLPADVKKRNAEIENLSKMYAQKGMTPELARKIAELRAAQGKGANPRLSPDLMASQMKRLAAMKGRMPAGPVGALMDPRFSPVVGKITSRSKISLTSDAVLSVRVLDITKADEPRIIAEQAVVNPGQMPCSFQVWYNKQNVSPKRKYAVQAFVADRGEIKWKSTAECKPVSQGQPVNIEVPLQPFKQPEPPVPGVLVGDTKVSFEDRKPFLADGGWMVPVAPVLKAAGVEVQYSDSSKELTVRAGDSSLSAKLPGRTVLLTDGSKRDLTSELQLRNGAVYAPIQFLQMATHRKALFDRESNTIVLIKM